VNADRVHPELGPRVAARLITLILLILPIAAACGTQPPVPAPAGTQSTKPSRSAAADAAKAVAEASAGAFVIADAKPLSRTVHPYPTASSYGESWSQAARLIWGAGLLDLDANTLEYIPYLASEWNISDDGKTVTFKLRDGLKWSDGQPLTVDDFLFAWQNAAKEENDFAELDALGQIESYTSPGPGSIVVKLDETLARDIALAVANTIVPVPRHVWSGKPWNDPVVNPEISKPSVVSGPYVPKEWNATEGAVLERNPSWFKGQPSLERVVLRPIQPPSAAVDVVRGNQAHWAPTIQPSQYADARQDPNLNLYEWSAANGVYRVLEFNLTREPLKDKRLREALSRAVNRQEAMQVAESTPGDLQYTFLSPGNTRWHNANVEKYEFSLDRARTLLQEAGYRREGDRLLDPRGQALELQLLYPSSSGPRARLATYLQQQYRQLGVELETKGLETNAYFDEVTKGNFDLSLGTWGGGSIDPDLAAKGQLVSGGPQNLTGFSNERVDNLFRQAASELDPIKRKALYDELQRLVSDELPSLYLYVVRSFSPMSKSVAGVQPNKLEALDLNDALTRWSHAR